MARGPRILKETLLPAVIKRLMREMKVEISDIVSETNLPYTTIWDWTQGVIPSNPDQVKKLLEFFKKRDPDVTLELLYYGKDEDKAGMRKMLRELQEKEKRLKHELALQGAQISMFEEIRKQEKLQKVKDKEDRMIESKAC